MRPIALDMNGFASFRAAARVDFTDADFFALVGPTGSGKSTIIDAMTFALYGSVPRWGRKGMVSLALAPTTARGTVKLVFEAGGQRYVVARELRRLGSQVSQRAASLERVMDPRGLAEPGAPTEVLAKDRGVADAVERLLGLSYEDFCQCVVLPQGQFAAFLHARASERQEILLRLLGAEHYQQIMKRANQRASEAAQRAGALGETLATFGDATQEAEDAARVAEAALVVLSERVRGTLPDIHSAAQDLAGANDELARLEREKAMLAGVRVPAGVAELDADLGVARETLDQAYKAEHEAGKADTTARQALADGPQRAPLERVRERRAERDQCLRQHPSLQEEAGRLAGLSRQADTAAAEASAALEEARVQRDEAASRADTAAQAVRDLSAAYTALTAVELPDGVTELDGRVREAMAARQEAQATLDEAEQAESQARQAQQSASDLGALEQAARDLDELRALAARLTEAEADLARTRVGRESADEALDSAKLACDESQRRLDEARRAHMAADLRAHLVRGEPCAVCEQTVVTLPSPLDTMAIDDAETNLAQAAVAVRDAEKKHRMASSAETEAAATLKSLTGQRVKYFSSLRAALSGPLSGAALTAIADLIQPEPAPEPGTSGPAGSAPVQNLQEPLVTAALTQANEALQARRDLDRTARDAAAELDTARARTRSAHRDLETAEHETSAARTTLQAVRDPLVALGAPPVNEHAGLAAAWTELVSWATGLAQVRGGELAEARREAEALAEQLNAAQSRFTEAGDVLSGRQADATAAARKEQEAATQLSELTKRISQLGDQLRDAPGEDEISAQLALRDSLEAAAAEADQRLLAVRAEREQAEQTLDDLAKAGTAAREHLSATRDPLVVLGAPRLDAASLLAAWTALANWASREALARDGGITSAKERAGAARSRVDQLTCQLSADLASAGVDVAPDAVASGAAAAVAAAAERARSVTARVVERRAQATDLLSKRNVAQAEHDVAKLLGDLLRSDRFQRWLVIAAIDSLVDHASKNLAELSGGQFDLTHENGDFYVIDHADADSRRSVRTLSGGETFQASLALALALSAQMTALAAAGAAQLDSIFLDEGFGTLDPGTLDVVAATLETLAQGERMVGVITHVAALAERVPVRFRVARDTRTSTVTRETVSSPDDAA